MISTLPVFKVHLKRIIAKRLTGQSHKTVSEVTIPGPSTVPVYNATMGGVDLLGYFLSLVRFSFRSHKWTNSVLMAYLAIGMSNAHKCYCRMVKVIPFSNFINESIDALMKHVIVPLTPARSLCVNNRRHSTTLERTHERLDQSPEHVVLKYSNKGKTCVVCRAVRPSFKCAKCKIFICVDEEEEVSSVEETCWYKYHNLQIFTENE